jgi:dephospho-CoA kinase
MKIIGIAGESGTGKSMVAEHLAARGGLHIDADRVGHQLLASDQTVIDRIRDFFGDGVFSAEGYVDRRKLGAEVFGNETKRLGLNDIIHPAIRRRCGEIAVTARKQGTPFVIIDAALLLESVMPFEFDLVLALRAPHRVQMERLRARGGYTEAEIQSRLASQADIKKSFYKADVVVDTDKTRDEVLDEIDALVDELLNNQK